MHVINQSLMTCIRSCFSPKWQSTQSQHSRLKTLLRHTLPWRACRKGSTAHSSEDSLGNDGNVLMYTVGYGGSTYTSNTKTMKALGIDHTAANTLARKKSENTIVSAHTTLKFNRFLEGCPQRQTMSRPAPHEVTSFVTIAERH